MANDTKNTDVLIILGSKSDEEYLPNATQILDNFGISYETHVCSAHRQPQKLDEIIRNAEKANVKVIIAGAGLAAHLPGVIASQTLIPVIGVPIPAGTLGGMDALLSIVQMPKGIPVATVGVGRMDNAAILAAQIMASGGNENVKSKLVEYRKQWG
jgi:phosphoribosylaminoimidazole carboxylase PurE protein